MTDRLAGAVSAFDEAAGLGEVTADDGASYPFHCTQITDGSRTIAAGASVSFALRAGHLGRWEAAALMPIAAGG